ncbi:MAG: putative methyltransferase [Firmicutes bacterium]|nr:putative methyltransferase [Bacillota bacterium]
MSAKRVMLVYPYFYTGIKKDQLFPPLGIALLSAMLKRNGAEVMVLDCTFLTFDEALSRAESFKPEITGVYVMTTLANNALRIVEKLKDVNPESIYAAGGPLPTLYPERFNRYFDYVFRGEAAKSFPDFCRDYLNSFDREGFVEKIEAGLYPGMDSPAEHLTKEEIDACPIPDRSGFDHRKYQELSSEFSGKKTTSIMMTYGCPFSCDFCSKPVFGSQVRYRSLDRVFEEIMDILSYGYDSLWIADDLFTYDEKFLNEFCSRLISEELQITWSCLSRVDTITEETAKIMKRAGCCKVYLGIEAGNDEVLKLMNKKIDLKKVVKGVETFKSNGIKCAGFFIVGYPGETVETIEETFTFALSLGLDEISFNVPYPLPGSKLFEKVSAVSEDDWNFENETRFLYKSEFDEEWIKKRIEETKEEFLRARGE